MANSDNPTDYRKTLNITLGDKDPGAFPQRGNLPAKEPEIQARWDAAGQYRKSLDRPCPRGAFILHDGPPYSNGDIHVGHALNKTAKDIVTRFKTMQGFRSPYVPGWDNHGMPIENAVARRFRERKEVPERVALRRACREYAAGWVETQRKQFKRLGVRGDWDNPYLTMDHEFEAAIVHVFGELAAKGFIYRGLKPVLWCAICETALADAEVEYGPHTSDSIMVRFPLWKPEGPLFEAASGLPVYAIIWTTTPWTIPANLALAVHPDFDYSLLRVTIADPAKRDDTSDPREDGTAVYLVARSLVESTMADIGALAYDVLAKYRGSELEGQVFRHPLFHRTAPVVLAGYVTMDTGTGVVHTAPGHGKEDFETGQRYGLPVLNPVNASGRYTAEAGEFEGRSFEGLRVVQSGDKSNRPNEANAAVLDALRSAGNLLASSRIEHSYPHCWRCHSPLIFRATVQWFMNIDHEGHRQKALAAIGDVTWYPAESVNRITTMVGSRPDWCISRQRSWGVGIPAFYCDACGEHILTPESMAAVEELTRREGSDAWYEVPAADILPSGFVCPHCGAGAESIRKETDVLDVWFDSGSTNRAVLENRSHWPDLSWPCDMYLEGGDQHRGWFNSSLMISVATKGRAPYRSVVTNGWTLDENGRAMSKSLGNVVNPLTVIEKYGADVVRWWVASTNFMDDVGCGENVLKQVGDTYRRVRNTFRFLLNNLYDFDPERDSVPEKDLLELDRWALAHLDNVVNTCVAAYEAYEFHRVYVAVHNFCAVELSAFYLDVIKDRLYASRADWPERRSAQTAMHRMAETLARLLAPILVHTSEEVWDYVRLADKAESVHLAALPEPREPDTRLLIRWAPIIHTRDVVNKAIEQARAAHEIGNPLEARVDIRVSAEAARPLAELGDQLATVMLVSEATLSTDGAGDEIGIGVARAEGVKCARCWLIRKDVGVDTAHPTICGRCARAVSDE
jgi:isoleucyl-tRNA synthetase